MKDEIRLAKLFWRENLQRSTERLQAFVQGNRLGWTDRDEEVQVFGEARFAVKADCNPTDDEVSNPRVVECHQQIDPIA